MTVTKNKWVFSLLWINLAVAIVFMIQIAGSQNLHSRDLLHGLGFALVYANMTGLLGVVVLGGLAERLTLRKIPLAPVLAPAFVILTALGSLMAQTILMLIGFDVPSDFWGSYFRILRIAMPLALVFGLGTLAHQTLLNRLHAMEEVVKSKELAEERARKLATEARLSSLESRIHPHFLFNTLNSISSLISVDPKQAEQTVGRLAVLLRSSLDNSSQPLIPLRQELTMVNSYVDIQKIRFGEKLCGSVEVADELQDARVPPMSVQALVENAVKHGISDRGGGDFKVRARAENGSLRIEVCDSGPGFELAAVPAGHGLDNLVARLDTLFGSKACLNSFRRDGYSVVEMVVPLT
jgi:two-component system, LytTR family, sensor histidine kinase AlgZ